jgi:hypothetical protein
MMKNHFCFSRNSRMRIKIQFSPCAISKTFVPPLLSLNKSKRLVRQLDVNRLTFLAQVVEPPLLDARGSTTSQPPLPIYLRTHGTHGYTSHLYYSQSVHVLLLPPLMPPLSPQLHLLLAPLRRRLTGRSPMDKATERTAKGPEQETTLQPLSPNLKGERV